MGVIKVNAERDTLGIAWVVAPCGCRARLLDMHDPVQLNAFMTHVLERTNCDRFRPES